MPAPKAQRSTEWEEMHAKASEIGERNDCAVKAVAFAAGIPYERAWELLNKHGRKTGGGTLPSITEAVMKELGCELTEVKAYDFISRYPGHHSKALKNVTTHHPARFPDVWKDGQIYLMSVRGHILAVVNGEVMDWSRRRALRALRIMRVQRPRG